MALARLRIEGKGATPSGYSLWLDDQDISKVTRAVALDLDVNDVNTATLTVYVGELQLGTDVEPKLIRAQGKERTSFAHRFREWLR